MPDTLHTIKYNLINEENLDFVVKIFVQDELKVEINENTSVTEKVISFVHTYSNDTYMSTIKIITSGAEQPNKLLQIKNITVNKQPLNVLAGFYYPEPGSWWQSLSEEEYKQMKKKTVMHGANFGWFGTIDYEFRVFQNYKVHKKTNLEEMLSPGCRGIFL